MQRRDSLAGTTATAASIAGCLGGSGDQEAEILEDSLTLTTTTSTYDTGLLDELNAGFDERFGVTVDAVAQGTGAALETARNGDADVVMVHARSLEDEFLRAGDGVNRRDLMFNDYVVVGPSGDPAGIDGTDEVTGAFRAIADAESAFVSRGDDSGTHVKELDIWEEAGLEPGGEWYQERGDGMGPVLTHADQTDAYALADRSTVISMQSDLTLDVVVEGPIEGGSERLANPYGIVAVNPGVHDHVEYDLAMAYIGYLTGPAGQTIIEEFRVDGEQLFFPEAVAEDPNFEQYVPADWRSNGA